MRPGKHLLKTSIFITLLIAMACSGKNERLPESSVVVPENALVKLNTTIKRAKYYQKIKDRSFDSLKQKISSAGNNLEKWKYMVELSEQYRQVNADSAIYYGYQAVASAPDDLPRSGQLRERLAIVNALSTAGLFIPAVRGIDSIGAAITDTNSKIEFWKSSRMLYSYMLAYVQDHNTIAETYRKQYIACDDSLLTHLPQTDPFYKFIYCERLVSDGRWSEAKTNIEALMASQPPESNIYGMAAFQLAEVYKNKGDFRNYASWLATSAESDIKGCVKEGIALPTLANWLFEHGDLDNAFNYINFALEDANNGNIRMRTVTITSLMPLIDEAYRNQMDDSRNEILAFLIIVIVMLFVSGGLLIKLVRNNTVTKTNERKLALTSKKLEAYVGNFIGLCSTYAVKLDQLAKFVSRKISAGQADDLLKLVASGKFNEGNNDDFYKLIDKAILDIFPDFVESINALLVPEKRIEYKQDEPLMPELRIYAFVRLGVDQSSKIAQILNYSSNTVYAYRNRMRNRAIDRDHFDSDVANLGSSIRPFKGNFFN